MINITNSASGVRYFCCVNDITLAGSADYQSKGHGINAESNGSNPADMYFYNVFVCNCKQNGFNIKHLNCSLTVFLFLTKIILVLPLWLLLDLFELIVCILKETHKNIILLQVLNQNINFFESHVESFDLISLS